jgi:hypothetical protein
MSGEADYLPPPHVSRVSVGTMSRAATAGKGWDPSVIAAPISAAESLDQPGVRCDHVT